MMNAKEIADKIIAACSETDWEHVYTREMISAALKDYAEEMYMEGYRHSKEPGDIKAREQAVQILRELSFKEGFREGVEASALYVLKHSGSCICVDATVNGIRLLPPSAEKEWMPDRHPL